MAAILHTTAVVAHAQLALELHVHESGPNGQEWCDRLDGCSAAHDHGNRKLALASDGLQSYYCKASSKLHVPVHVHVQVQATSILY